MSVKIYDVSPRKDWCNQKVTGVSFYRSTLRQILTTVPSTTGSDVTDRVYYFPVTIVLEPDNPHDNQALSVRWNDQPIGHIPRADNAAYFPEFARLLASGCDAVTYARLWTSDPTANDPQVSMHVAIEKPGSIVPINNPPAEKWVLLPHGTATQVTKESDHFDVLQAYVPRGGTGLFLVSLHCVPRGVKTQKMGIEVRLDGQRIGELTDTSSAKFLPAVEHFDGLGLTTACKATLKGSALSAEVVLHAERAAELNAEMLTNPRVSPLPPLVPYETNPKNYQLPSSYIPDGDYGVMGSAGPLGALGSLGSLGSGLGSGMDGSSALGGSALGGGSAARRSNDSLQDDYQLVNPFIGNQTPQPAVPPIAPTPATTPGTEESLLGKFYDTVLVPSIDYVTNRDAQTPKIQPQQPRIQPQPQPQAQLPFYNSERSFGVYLLLLIFLGVFGAHHYYVGRIGKGLLYTFTSGLFMIGWIVDIANARQNFERDVWYRRL